MKVVTSPSRTKADGPRAGRRRHEARVQCYGFGMAEMLLLCWSNELAVAVAADLSCGRRICVVFEFYLLLVIALRSWVYGRPSGCVLVLLHYVVCTSRS